MDDIRQCNDYTTLLNYNAKIFRLDNVKLPTKTGFDLFHVLFGAVGGIAAFVVLWIPMKLFFGPMAPVVDIAVGIAAGVGVYFFGKIKSPTQNPFHMLSIIAVGNAKQQEEYPDDLHWQVIMVRHPWTRIVTDKLPTISGEEYDPDPVEATERLDSPSADVWDVFNREYAGIGTLGDYRWEQDGFPERSEESAHHADD
jgi:hypothetical protein